MAKLGVITDGISRDLEHALDVMGEFGLEYAELQFLWDREAGDLTAVQVSRAQDLVRAHDVKVSCISRHVFGGLAVGYMETVHKRRVDEIRDPILAEMTALRGEKGYAALLFMVVDIVHSQTEILVAGLEEEIAETFGQPLVAGHSILMGGVMSRKKQVVPVLPRVARQWKSRGVL